MTLRLAFCLSLASLFYASHAQVIQGKKYYLDDSTKIKEIFHFTAQDSLLNGSYESFYLNGSLKSYGWYSKNYPDSTWKYYYENGRAKAEGIYRKGSPFGTWKYYYENGNLKSKGKLANNQKQGHWNYYYESGAEKSNGNYVANKKEGIWNYFYEDHSLKAQAYVEGNKGKYTEFYPSGARRMEGYNADDKSEGEWIYYYETGEVEATGAFINGLKTGTWTYFHINGVVAGEGNYTKGLKNGNWIYYHDNGTKSQEGLMTADKKKGYWKLFYPSGEMQGEAHFNQGSGTFNEYYPGGSRKSEGNVINGKKEGLWRYYSEEGILEGEATFVTGEGDYVGYYPDKTIKMSGKLKGNKRIGTWILYNPDGSKAGSLHQIYEDEKPIFKSRVSQEPSQSGFYKKPDYKFKRREIKYFQPTINEYRGVAVATNPLWLITDQIPLSVEYYIQERLGHEMQVNILRNPFFRADSKIETYQKYRRGVKVQLRQKFYSQDSPLGMTYFGHQLSFAFIKHQVNHVDTTIVNAIINRAGSLNETAYGYGLLVGNRWMKDAGNSGFTLDMFVGLSVARYVYKKQYANNQIFDPYFEEDIKKIVRFPVIFGIHIGFVSPKSKSVTQP